MTAHHYYYQPAPPIARRTSTVDAARALIVAMTSTPDQTRQDLITAAINAMKTAGIWNKFDALWMPAAHDQQAANLNWKAPGLFTLSPQNAPAFAADQGYTGNGTNAYLGTGWNPVTNGRQYTLNSCHLGLWVRTTSASENTTDAGVNAGLRLDTRRVTNGFLGRINCTNTITGSNSTEGYFCINRSAADAVQVRKNNASLTTSAEASTAISGAELMILALANGTNHSTKQVSACHVGGSLTTDEIDTLYGILNTYMAGL